jgi:hypothetical protein
MNLGSKIVQNRVKLDPFWVQNRPQKGSNMRSSQDPIILHCAVYVMWARPAEGVHPNRGPKYHDLDPLKVVKYGGFTHPKSGHSGGVPKSRDFGVCDIHFLYLPTKCDFSTFWGVQKWSKSGPKWTNLEVPKWTNLRTCLDSMYDTTTPC